MAIRRNYIDVREVADATEDQVAQAEELIDSYVGYQERFIEREFYGQVQSVVGNVIVDNRTDTQLDKTDDYFVGCILEVIGGTSMGEYRFISASNRVARSLTLDGEDLTLDTTSIFRVYQLGKFPRCGDVLTNPTGTKYYKPIPRLVKDAVIAQTEYMIAMGNGFFNSNQADKQSESIGNYSYQLGTTSNQTKLIAPRVREILKRIRNATGRLLAENSTCL